MDNGGLHPVTDNYISLTSRKAPLSLLKAFSRDFARICAASPGSGIEHCKVQSAGFFKEAGNIFFHVIEISKVLRDEMKGGILFQSTVPFSADTIDSVPVFKIMSCECAAKSL